MKIIAILCLIGIIACIILIMINGSLLNSLLLLIGILMGFTVRNIIYLFE